MIADYKRRRQRGDAVNDEDEANRITWQEWDGLKVIEEYADKSDTPGLLLQVATGQAELPDFENTPIDATKSAKDNPNIIHDQQKKALKKHRSALKELAGVGLTKAKELLDEVPKTDKAKRLLAINSVIAAKLGEIQEGCGTTRFTETVRAKCREIGEPRFEELPGDCKEAIFTGAKVHPLAIKP